jgi:hypothetical protein
MIEGQEVVEMTNSPTFCWSSANKGSFSSDIYGCFFIRSVPDAIFAMLFLP